MVKICLYLSIIYFLFQSFRIICCYVAICKNGTACSHMCNYRSDQPLLCYCPENSDDVDMYEKSTYCLGRTILAVSGQIMVVVGLAASVTSPCNLYSPSKNDYNRTFITQVQFNIGSISAITYNTVEAKVVVVSYTRRHMYAFNHKTQELRPIYKSSYEITSLRYDSFGNNVYLISQSRYIIDALSFHTLKFVAVYEGYSQSKPVDVALYSFKGYMFILLLEKETFVLKRISMDGDLTTAFKVYEQERMSTDNTYLVPVYDRMFMNSARVCIFTSGSVSLNCVEVPGYLTDSAEKTWKNFTYTITMMTDGKELRSLTTISLVDDWVLYWIGESKSIHRGQQFTDSFNIQEDCHLELRDLLPGEESVDIISIPRAESTNTISACLTSNGGCEHVCLNSERYGPICKCSKDYEYKKNNNGSGRTCVVASSISVYQFSYFGLIWILIHSFKLVQL